MAKIAHKLAAMAADKGCTVDELVIKSIQEGGSKLAAARLLGVNPNTIRHHVKRMGLHVTTQIVAHVEVEA